MPSKTRPYYFDARYNFRDTGSGNSGTWVRYGDYQLVGNNAVSTDPNSPGRNHRYLISNGLNATTGLSGTEYVKKCNPTDFKCKAVYTSGAAEPYFAYELKGNLCAALLGNGNVSDLTYANTFLVPAENQARTRFYSQLADTITSFKGAVFAGELRESLQMIRNPARSLRRGISDYLDRLKKDGPRKARRDRPKFVRDTWLEYAFGWRPLVNDLENGMAAFMKSQWPRPIFKMVRGRGSAGARPKLLSPGLAQIGGAGVYFQYYIEETAEAQIKYYGIARSSGNGPSSFSYYGFTPTEFIPTIWELIPYSFLVDYFTNVGDIINSWSYRNIGCDWVSKGQLVLNRREIRKADLVILNPSIKFADRSGATGGSTLEFTSKLRLPSVTVPLPALQFQVPGMGTKWVNIAALTTQLGNTRRSLAS